MLVPGYRQILRYGALHPRLCMRRLAPTAVCSCCKQLVLRCLSAKNLIIMSQYFSRASSVCGASIVVGFCGFQVLALHVWKLCAPFLFL